MERENAFFYFLLLSVCFYLFSTLLSSAFILRSKTFTFSIFTFTSPYFLFFIYVFMLFLRCVVRLKRFFFISASRVGFVTKKTKLKLIFHCSIAVAIAFKRESRIRTAVCKSCSFRSGNGNGKMETSDRKLKLPHFPHP